MTPTDTREETMTDTAPDISPDPSFRPFSDRVLVRPIREKKEQTDGGIFLPPSAQEEKQRGKVLAVGPGRYTDKAVRVPMDVEPGMIVEYGKYAGKEFNTDSEELLLLREHDIDGVWE